MFDCFVVAPGDFLPLPGAVLRFQERNVNWPLCKEIIIVDDCYAEMVEEFDVQVLLALPGAVGVEVQFIPSITTIKITDNDAPEGNLILLIA